MNSVTFEVLVCTSVQVGNLERHRWYMESLHTDLKDAREWYEQVTRTWNSRKLLVCLVRSEFDEKRGIYEDRVIEARDRSILFSRKSVKKLTPENRQLLNQIFRQPEKEEEDDDKRAGFRTVGWDKGSGLTAREIGVACLLAGVGLGAMAAAWMWIVG